jgi:hypothetical protein
MFQKKVIEKIRTHMLCSVTLSENYTVFEILWRNMVDADRPQMAI